MSFRSDLALDRFDTAEAPGSQKTYERLCGHVRVMRFQEKSADLLGQFANVSLLSPITDEEVLCSLAEEICLELQRMLPPGDSVLCVGLGNPEVEADALGLETVFRILANRRAPGEDGDPIGRHGRTVCCMSADVFQKTGLFADEQVRGAAELIGADYIIAFDALGARSGKSLCRTVQLSDCGILPGSGAGQNRRELTARTAGIPVISLGAPTVIAGDGAGAASLLTAIDIRFQTGRLAAAMAAAVNSALLGYPVRDLLSIRS